MDNKNKGCNAMDEVMVKVKEKCREITKGVKEGKYHKMNLIWFEANGCSGNIISLLNASDPEVGYFLKNMVNITYENSIMSDQGQRAYEKFLDTLNTEFILVVEGAVSLKDNGKYNIVATYEDVEITAKDAIKLASRKAKYILAVGNCAAYGGISAADPNPSGCISLPEYIKDKWIIRLPGCPCNPYWVIGTTGELITRGLLEIDKDNRPIEFYGNTIHDACPRRGYFEKKIFAKALGNKECMLRLGCRGPVTRANCPIVEWNDHSSWPIGINTPCIGCTNPGFPDKMEPFVRY